MMRTNFGVRSVDKKTSGFDMRSAYALTLRQAAKR
jgi:hypothetical protein